MKEYQELSDNLKFKSLRNAFLKVIETLATSNLSEKDIENKRMDIMLFLVKSDVALEVIDYLIDSLKTKIKSIKVKRFANKKSIIEKLLKESIKEIFEDAGKLDIEKIIKEKKNKPFVMLFVGPNGHGKTTTIAKIANYLKKKNISSVIAASDTFRAGAIEQLLRHAKNIGIKVIRQKYGADPAAVAYDAILHAKRLKIDTVLIDTAGRMETNKNLLDEMKKIARVANPDTIIFVGDALTGNDALEQAKIFNSAVPISGSVLTKIDAGAKGGGALSIVYITKRPIVFLGTGQGYDDLIEFNVNWFLKNLGFEGC